jgi:hypothetical protein
MAPKVRLAALASASLVETTLLAPMRAAELLLMTMTTLMRTPVPEIGIVLG